MIGKAKLLKKIREVMETKKNVIPLLDKHLSASLTFSGLDPVTVKTIRDRCQAWMILQTKHVEVLKEMSEDLQKRENDVF